MRAPLKRAPSSKYAGASEENARFCSESHSILPARVWASTSPMWPPTHTPCATSMATNSLAAGMRWRRLNTHAATPAVTSVLVTVITSSRVETKLPPG